MRQLKRMMVLALATAPLLLGSCNNEFTRPRPKFEVVEEINGRFEGLLDLGMEVSAKVHNYGAAGTQNVRFILYTGYRVRHSSSGNKATWDSEFTETKKLFLDEGETKTLSHVFKEINALDDNIRYRVEILN